MTAFVTLEIRQAGGHDPVAGRLAAIPDVRSATLISLAAQVPYRVLPLVRSAAVS